MTNVTTQETAKAKLIAKIKGQSTQLLKESAELLMDSYEDGAGVAFVFVLTELENRMTEAEYIEFCDSL